MSGKLRIVFMGTPQFAVPSLNILVENNYEIAGVITSADKPGGRGLKPQVSAIKKYALEKNLPLLQPENLKEGLFLKDLRAWKPDLQVVVAFRMLPEEVWSLPPKGTFNLHASLLPQYRGAAPINWAVMNGEAETGVSTFFIDKDIDTGKIIYRENVEIGEDETAGELHDELMFKGADLVLKTVQVIEEGNPPQHDQTLLCPDPSTLKKAPKITSATRHINWNKNVRDVYNKIRGLSPYPAAWTELITPDGKHHRVKIYRASEELCSHDEPPGAIFTNHKTDLYIAAKDGFIHLKELQVAGKKKMDIEEFLRGFSIDLHVRVE